MHEDTITNTQRSRVALEATELIARHFGSAPTTRLHNLGLELQLGLDVIATDYGGNTDFSDGPLSHPVRCREVPIPRGAYPCADGHCWGEPDLDHAAQLMQEVAELRAYFIDDPASDSPVVRRNQDITASYRECFSFKIVGERYQNRLVRLWDV